MTRDIRRAAVAGAIAALAALAPVARASSFSLGAGHAPRVAVDAKGSGFFTWTESAGGVDRFHLCGVRQGASSCGSSFVYHPPAESGLGTDPVGGYALLAPAGRVLLVDARCCAHAATKELFSSSDGGVHFGPVAQEPGFMDASGDNIAGAALYAPAGAVGRSAESILTISSGEASGVRFQATGTTNGSESDAVDFGSLVPGADYQGSLALRGDSTLVATFATRDTLYWSRWAGSSTVNSAASWTTPAAIGPTNADGAARLASGPSGIFVAYSVGGAGNERYVLRKLTGAGWSSAHTLTETGSPRGGDLVEDPAGVLHFAWRDGKGRLRYRYARDATDTAFTQAQTLSGSGQSFAGLRLAVAKSGRGFVAWERGGSIHALPVSPGEPPPAPYSGRTRRTTKSVGGDRLVLTSPAKCVTVPQVFAATVGVEAKAGGSPHAKVAKVVFTRDGKPVGTDKKKPFRLDVPTFDLRRGTKHSLAAKVSLAGGSAKTLETSFHTC